MSIGKTLFRIWLLLSIASLAIDAACFWLSQHAPAALPERPTINFIIIFLVSAPAPLVLGLFLTALGVVLTLSRWIWLGLSRLAFSRPLLSPSGGASSRTLRTLRAHHL